MKYSIYTFVFLLGIVYTSCNEDDERQLDQDKKEEIERVNDARNNDKDERVKKGDCYELIYPVSYTLPDGTKVTGENEKEIWEAMKKWFTDHPDARKKYNIIYPVEVVFKDEHIKVTSDEEFALIKKECNNETYDPFSYYEKACFEFEFPISFILPDGSRFSAEEKIEITKNLKEWYSAHPNSDRKPKLNYPIKISFKDELFTLSNDEHLVRFMTACKG